MPEPDASKHSRLCNAAQTLTSHKDMDGKNVAEALCIAKLFSRPTTALSNVHGALRLKPGETTHHGSKKKEISIKHQNRLFLSELTKLATVVHENNDF